MTSPAERRRAFIQRCVEGDDRGAVRIDTPPDRRREAERCWNQADFHRQAAEDNLGGQAELMAIRQGYYVMLHKANQALALAGFAPKTHRCTLLGIRGIFDAPDLADALRRASTERNNVDYAMNPERPRLEEFEDAPGFVRNTVQPFVERTDGKIGSVLDLEPGEWNGGPDVV